MQGGKGMTASGVWMTVGVREVRAHGTMLRFKYTVLAESLEVSNYLSG